MRACNGPAVDLDYNEAAAWLLDRECRWPYPRELPSRQNFGLRPIAMVRAVPTRPVHLKMPYCQPALKRHTVAAWAVMAMSFGAACLPTSRAMSGEPPAAGRARAEALEFFEKRVRPLLVENCLACHGEKREGGLRLDTPDEMAKGGDSGAAIVAGDPAGSLLVKAVHYDDEPKMPPKGKLADESIAALETWIKLGAPWPAGAAARLTTPTVEETRKSHWAFQPIRDPEPPPVTDVCWLRSSVDPFVLAKLEAAKLTPSAPADRRTLIRRASFDVLGLPPTAAEVDAFVNDPAPDAFAHVIERLLASPHYGERWGRHWLDVARYADTKGYVFTQDRKYPNAYRYRDWVVEALNARPAVRRVSRRADRGRSAAGQAEAR